MKNGGDWMESLDSASAAWLTFTICKRASICWLSATQHPFRAFIQPPQNRYRSKILKYIYSNWILPIKYWDRIFLIFCCRRRFSIYEDVALLGDEEIGRDKWKLAFRWICQAFHKCCYRAAPSSWIHFFRLFTTQEIFVEILGGDVVRSSFCRDKAPFPH